MQTKHQPDSDRLLAALSYVWILFVIPFAVGHNKPFVYKHARQGLTLFIVELILLGIGVVPILGWLIAFVGWLAVMVVAVIGISHALSSQAFTIPVVGKMLDTLMKK